MEVKLTENVSIDESILCSIDKGIIPHIVDEPRLVCFCLHIINLKNWCIMKPHKKMIYSYSNKCLREECCNELDIIFDLKSVGFDHPNVTKYYVGEHTKLFVNACCKFKDLIRF